MNIELPKKLVYSTDPQNLAHVENRTLYIEGDIRYKGLMYTISYSIHGYECCSYCGRRLTRENRTMDHLYPQAWGGVTIPNNLVPCCARCNSQKTYMTYQQYLSFKKLTGREATLFRKQAIRENKARLRIGFIVPKPWLSVFDIDLAWNKVNDRETKRYGFLMVEEYYSKNGHYPRPVIVSSNGWIFKERDICLHAKLNGIKTVPAVVMENVVRLKPK